MPRPAEHAPPSMVASPEDSLRLHHVTDSARPLVEPLDQFVASIGPTPIPHLELPIIWVGQRVSHRRWHRALTVGQGARGTCWAFAGVAALEGALARKGINEKLSEHYLFSLIKAHENQAHPNTLHSLMGFGGNAGVVRLMRHLGIPPASRAPYIDQAPLKALADSIPQTGNALTAAGGGSKSQADWLEFDLRNIPVAARWGASYRVTGYGTCAATVAELKKAIAAGRDVLVDVNDKINNGGHVILLIGFDDNTSTFEIKNSQGAPGFATMAYTNDAQFDLIPGSSGYFITSAAREDPQWAAMWVGRWQMDQDGWLGRLTVRRFTDIQKEPTVLPSPSTPITIGHWYGADGSFKSVTAGFVEDGRGMVATISGQKFELWLHGRDPWHAGGRCWSDGKPYGAVLCRGPTIGAGSGYDRSEAIGQWDAMHDGWRGQLRIGAAPYYVEADSATARAVSIAPEPAATINRVEASIGFGQPPQLFTILMHTREDGIFGGITTVGNATYPVTGRMSPNFYAVRDDGVLVWYRHAGRASRTAAWDDPAEVGTGWASFSRVFGGADGVLYAIMPDGTLHWYFHEGRNSGTRQWQGGRQVGTGWQHFRHVFAGSGGVIYAVGQDGRLFWYRHLGRRDGSARWVGPTQVGTGWADFVALVAGADGDVYGQAIDGALYWYRHDGADHGFPIWHGPVKVGQGWHSYRDMWIAGNGYIYARDAAGGLWMWRHIGFRNGEASWTAATRVGSGWKAGFRHVALT